jgi:amidase
VTTFITRLVASGSGPTLAVKDLVDVEGVPTTAGSRAVADGAGPAAADAACLDGARRAGARIVGKTNLFELAYGASGINEWFGTPINPLDPRLVPGGSSSGSAVAVALGEADVAFGTDTGGSVRVPSAFCGTTGLKTTYGRVSTRGVWPLAPSLDTVGPMARDIAGVVAGMQLLEPGFVPSAEPATVVGRLRCNDVPVDPVIDAAVDQALVAAGLELHDVELASFAAAHPAGADLLDSEAAVVDAHLMNDPELRAKLGVIVASRLAEAAALPPARASAAKTFQTRWKPELERVFRRVQLVALPTVGFFPPPLQRAGEVRYTRLTMPFNLSGSPAVSVPVPSESPLPASLQLVGPTGSEELLLATGALIESAVG